MGNSEASTRGRIAALYKTLKPGYSGSAATAKARKTWLDRFQSAEERREYYRKLAIKSVIARGRKLRKPVEESG
jgi:hypothetical protein